MLAQSTVNKAALYIYYRIPYYLLIGLLTCKMAKNSQCLHFKDRCTCEGSVSVLLSSDNADLSRPRFVVDLLRPDTEFSSSFLSAFLC